MNIMWPSNEQKFWYLFLYTDVLLALRSGDVYNFFTDSRATELLICQKYTVT